MIFFTFYFSFFIFHFSLFTFYFLFFIFLVFHFSLFRFFKGSDEPFELWYNFTCDTRNLLYVITCQGCGENYIGKTERELRERCTDYRTAIQGKKFTQGVHEHVSTCGNGQFTMTPFFKNS